MALVIAHAHTNWSHDGVLSLGQWHALAKQRRCDAVLLTEHEEAGWTPDRYAEYVAACNAVSSPDTRLIPGIEFNQDGFHVLCYGLRYWPDRPSSAAELAAAVHAQGCLLCLAHPGRYQWNYPEGLLGAVDAVEVWNSSWVCDGTLGPHPKSLELAEGKALLVGQDVHKPKHISGLYIHTLSPNILADLKAGRYVFGFGRRSWAPDELRNTTLVGVLQRWRTVFMRAALQGYQATRRRLKPALARLPLDWPRLLGATFGPHGSRKLARSLKDKDLIKACAARESHASHEDAVPAVTSLLADDYASPDGPSSAALGCLEVPHDTG